MPTHTVGLRRAPSHAVGAALALALMGCTGSISDPAVPMPPTGVEVPTPASCESLAQSVGPSPLRRLTQVQYRNTINDVIGVEVPIEAERWLIEMVDGREGGFESTTSVPGTQNLRGYLSLSEALAPSAYERFVDCEPSERECAELSLRRFARLLYRRALFEEDVASLMQVYDELVEFGEREALNTAFSTALVSPSFLYHSEPVLAELADGGVVPLDAFALANRLAFFLWVGPPDEALLDRAEAGELSTSEDIDEEIVRMLQDPKAQRQTDSFYAQWLEVEAIEALVRDDPAFDDSVREAMAREPLHLVNTVLSEVGTLAELFTADYTVGDDATSALYGADPPDADGKIALDRAQRSGVLTLPGVLAAHGTSYPLIHRGAWIRNVLLCDPAPPPPDIELDGSVERLETQPCAACHIRMDPIGMGFAAFDDVGRFVEGQAQGGEVVSPDGSLDVAGAFATPRELGERMASSEDVSNCFAQQWFRFGFGRANEAADACELFDAQQAFAESGGDLGHLSAAFARTLAFRSRSTAALEAEEL